ncbi:FAD-dependent oxidoreductase [Agrococcus jejuensis]|uniref:Ferredoxin-NADP reductase n=1 Tax=Agrococcus jejuensis TaxID=399736 RepID=A0A1G8BD87_9MICO|nr:FAD-dependent oxidoreductase [Agrococcus jejuensis]SDH30560.1 Ferredoxin-NADP reductase [Agrococcus jejuensis]
MSAKTPIARLDAVPMHVLVGAILSAHVVLAALLSFAGVLGRDGAGILASAVVAVVVSIAASLLFGRIARRPAHVPSAAITGLLIALIAFPPSMDRPSGIVDLAVVAAVCALAAAAKALIVWRGRLVVNPAAAGLVIAGILLPLIGVNAAVEGWWIASPLILPLTIVGGALVAIRTRIVAPTLALVVTAVVLVTIAQIAIVGDAASALAYAIWGMPTLFLASFMFSEPVTLPPLRTQRIAVGVLVGVLVALPSLAGVVGIPLGFGVFYFLQAAALVVGNVVAFLLGSRHGTVLRLTGMERDGDLVDLRFVAEPELAHRPGQWVELSLPHRADLRGERRVFSVASPPGSLEVRLGIRAAAPISSFKQHLLDMAPGDTVAVTRQGGDFTPKPGVPRLFVAAGIGVTPFLSHLAAGDDDTVLVLLVRDGEPVPFAAALAKAHARVVIVTPTAPEGVPERWEHESGRIDGDRLRALVPDVAERQVLVSGSSEQVGRLRRIAKAAGARRVLVDAFAGY